MSIEVGNLVMLDGETYIVNSASPSAIKFYDISSEFGKMYLDTKKDILENGITVEDNDGNEITLRWDEEDEEYRFISDLVDIVMGCMGHDNYKFFRGTTKWDLVEQWTTSFFSDPEYEHLEFKMVHTQLIKLTNLKTLRQEQYQYFLDENGNVCFVYEHAGYDNSWSGGNYIDEYSAVFTRNDDCWEIATNVRGLNLEEDDIELEIL